MEKLYFIFVSHKKTLIFYKNSVLILKILLTKEMMMATVLLWWQSFSNINKLLIILEKFQIPIFAITMETQLLLFLQQMEMWTHLNFYCQKIDNACTLKTFKDKMHFIEPAFLVKFKLCPFLLEELILNSEWKIRKETQPFIWHVKV